ncbi:MAG: O-succinylhomoserine (thiol)-lyase [Proteobacteria bacterium]|nr:MAG: O-succinylhomoserine (thiol)-lyase [Pseudomonadota bacterium]
MNTPSWSQTTQAVRAALESDAQHGAVVPPIHLSSTYAFRAFGERRTYDYSRSGNPTRDALGEALARLEGAAGCVVTASGMAAVTLVCQLLEAGDRLVAPHDCYGGTHRLLCALARRGVAEVEFVDQTDPAALEAAIARGPKLVWVETPSNPLLRIVDIRRVAERAHAAGALLLVDNTFMSPVWQQPLALGADLVLHSTTKYLNGHSDVVGGAVAAATPELHEQLVWWANCIGVTGAPFDSYLTLRGLRTLHARMSVHGENAARVCELLVAHPAVARVHYPGLPTHPQHALARRQQAHFGAMLSFELAGGVEQVCAFLQGLRCFSLAESLGGVESLVAHPASMTHAAMSPQARQCAGISETLLRLSIGIEDAQDLLQDLQGGLDRAAACRDVA